MGFAAILTLLGWRLGPWHVPALALLGYVLMRGVILFVPDWLHEIAGCTLWLCIAMAMGYKGGAVPGLLYAASALTYPVLLTFGYRMEYMGLSPIIAEAFAVCALLWIGGGIGGVVISANRDMLGFMDRPHGAAVSMAEGKASTRINRPQDRGEVTKAPHSVATRMGVNLGR
jgi:hypothetical protein